MAFEVLITDGANDDLRKIVNYIKKRNPTAAAKLGYALLNQLKKLEEFPLIGRVFPERGDPNLREIIFKSYRIIYRVKEESKLVEVLRFWHGAQRKPKLYE